MKTAAKINFDWPEMPVPPPLGQPVLIRVATSQSRQVARQELRTTLRQILAMWSNLSPEELPLRETARGPVWLGQLAGHDLDISLSYAEGEGWIGLLRDGLIGVDAMQIQHIPEVEDVARHYLGPDILVAIRQSADPAEAFASAWTELEARLKCLKHELDEWPVVQKFAPTKFAIKRQLLSGRLMVTMASVTDTSA